MQGLKKMRKKGDDDDDDDLFGGGKGKGKGSGRGPAPAPREAFVSVGWSGTVGAASYSILSVPVTAIHRVSSLACKAAATFESPKGFPLSVAKETASFVDVRR